MGVLKRKQENEAISFKLPASLKREIEVLRLRAEEAGFDLGESIGAALWRLCKQMKAELERAARGDASFTAGLMTLRRRSCNEFRHRVDDRFWVAERADLEAGSEAGKGREFVEQDKGPAVRHGIFGGLLDELAGLSRRRAS
jgi:hypothetical protein